MHWLLRPGDELGPKMALGHILKIKRLFQYLIVSKRSYDYANNFILEMSSIQAAAGNFVLQFQKLGLGKLAGEGGS